MQLGKRLLDKGPPSYEISCAPGAAKNTEKDGLCK